jgi:RimJ/RimL family protein N-acetyltransferase
VADATSLTSTPRRITERVGRFRRRLFEVVPVDIVEREVAKPVPPLKPIPGAEIHRVSATNSVGWREILPREQWKTVERFLARGDYGYLATVDGCFAGKIWVSRVSHRDPWSGLNIRLARDEAYTYAMEVEVAYRRPGVGAAVVAAMLVDLREERSAKRVYGWVDSRNRASQTLLRIVFGFTQVQTVKRLHLPRLGWQVPGSDEPRFGPVSRVGHHSAAMRP